MKSVSVFQHLSKVLWVPYWFYKKQSCSHKQFLLNCRLSYGLRLHMTMQFGDFQHYHGYDDNADQNALILVCMPLLSPIRWRSSCHKVHRLFCHAMDRFRWLVIWAITPLLQQPRGECFQPLCYSILRLVDVYFASWWLLLPLWLHISLFQKKKIRIFKNFP